MSHPEQDAGALRQAAETLLADRAAAAPPSEADARRDLHELQVHQIELELQNEALQDALQRLEALNASQQALLHEVGAARVAVKFRAKMTSATMDAAGAVVEGSPSEIAEHVEVWTFARPFAARDPNWRLVATQAAN